MKTILFSLTLAGSLGLAGAAFAADFAPAPPPPPAPPPLAFGPGKYPPVVVQIGPTTGYSTLNCANFAKAPDGTWRALNPSPFGLGFVQGIVPPVVPIKVGGFIYNNIDLYSQLDTQCGAALVTAKY